MTPPKDSDNKKGELLQLRVDKLFLDRVNAIAQNKHLPLSAMLRSWLAERLSEELKLMKTERLDWQGQRFEAIDMLTKNGFEPGPMLVAHAYPLTPGVVVDVKKMERSASALIPSPLGITGFSGRVNQFGYEMTRQHGGVIHAKGQFFKSGQIEGIFSVDFKRKEIFGRALDHCIVTVIDSYSHLLRSQEIPLPYLFKFFLLFAKGYSMTVHETLASSSQPPAFEQDRIELSDIVIDDFDQLASQLSIGNHVLPNLDELWNASGQPCSASYNDEGTWTVRR